MHFFKSCSCSIVFCGCSDRCNQRPPQPTSSQKMNMKLASAAPPSNNLGNNTKSLQDSGISLRNQAAGEGKKSAKATAYALRNQAGRLLFDGTGAKKQKFRVCHCGRSIKGDVVMVYRSPDGSKAALKGTILCGSAWTCPICAYRIGEIRREELQAARKRSAPRVRGR